MKKYTIATVVKADPHPWFNRMRTGIEKFSKDTGHNTFLLGPPHTTLTDQKLEEQVIKQVLAQKVDAICVVVFFPQFLEMLLNQARRNGVVVITHEAPNLRNTDYDIEAFDNTAYGERLVDYLAELMGKQGRYAVFLESLMTKSHSEWATGAINRQIAQYPDLKLVKGKIEHHDDETVGYAATKELLAAHPNLKGILGLGGPSVVGAAKAVDEAGLSGTVKIVGNCLTSMGRTWLRKGTVQMISFWDPADIGYVMDKLAVMTLNGEKVTDGMDFGVPGYNHIKLEGKVLYGNAWIDVTQENMGHYNF
jgi:simple sugar transport system substrate-binding protein